MLSASYNYSIDSVSGSGVPALDPTGINGTESGTHTGMSGTYTVVLSSSSPAPNTKLVATMNNTTVLDCVAITGDGPYNLNITASASDDVRIAVNFGPC